MRWFGTGIQTQTETCGPKKFLYALRREVVRNWDASVRQLAHECFYTPFGVRWFGTSAEYGDDRPSSGAVFLYALRREVVRNPTPVDGSLTSTFGRPLHARLARVSTRS